MTATLYALAFILALSVSILVTGGAAAILICALLAIPAGIIIYQAGEERTFLLRVFIGGLMLRVAIGTVLYLLDQVNAFGPDSQTYDLLGYVISSHWLNEPFYKALPYINPNNLGMSYVVGGIYLITGRNPLAVQYFNAVLGAATAPVIFMCAQQIYGNLRASRIAAMLVLFFPSLVLWSSLGLKDASVVFLLALIMLSTLKLNAELTIKYAAVLVLSLVCLVSVRFYIFYMMLIVVGGSFVVGTRAYNIGGFIRNFMLLVVIGLALTYLGVLRNAPKDIAVYGNLEKIQDLRKDATRAGSGFGREVDVSTTRGALSALPLGLLFVLFAPFPWQVTSMQQALTLPEMVVWWASFPVLVIGMKYSVQHRLRQTAPVFMFTVLTTLVYSLFQGNVGTAYRQRAQLLVFYFIFIAVGIVVLRERRENRLAARPAEQVPVLRSSDSEPVGTEVTAGA